MRLSLIKHAEELAVSIIERCGKEVDSLSVGEMAENYLQYDSGIINPPDSDSEEFMDFCDYVDYLIDKAEIAVKLPKERL